MTTTPDPCTCRILYAANDDRKRDVIERCPLCASAGLMRDALAPLAVLADAYSSAADGSYVRVPIADVRRARAALAATKTPTDTGSHV